MHDYLKHKQLPITVESIRRTKIHMVYEQNTEMPNCTAFQCLGYTTSHGNHAYILSSGIWYQVDVKFIEQTNRVINKLKKGPILPAWTLGEKEGAYNVRCCANKKYLYCDAENFSYGGGRSKFELCDCVDVSGRVLFFVKNVAKSSGMSHLVEQVRRTSQLLFSGDSGYRRQVSKKLAKTYPASKLKWLDERPQQGHWDLCLVSLGRPAERLPFFAKCSLTKLLKELNEQGHYVSFRDV